MKLHIFILISLLFLSLSGAEAKSPPPAPNRVYEDNKEDIQKIEQYLSSFQTMRARFVQTADDGTTAEGNLFLARPGKIRFEYDAPSPILLVSDGIMLTFYDANLQQVSNIPIGSTPAEIITAKHVKLNNDKFKITRFEKKDDETSVTFVKTEAPDDGSITLYFSEKPLELARWAVRDAQQNQTKITLKDVTKDLKLESKIFYFDDPRPKEER